MSGVPRGRGRVFRCDDCPATTVRLIPTPHGWMVTCPDGHEVIPVEGVTVLIDPAVTPASR